MNPCSSLLSSPSASANAFAREATHEPRIDNPRPRKPRSADERPWPCRPVLACRRATTRMPAPSKLPQRTGAPKCAEVIAPLMVDGERFSYGGARRDPLPSCSRAAIGDWRLDADRQPGCVSTGSPLADGDRRSPMIGRRGPPGPTPGQKGADGETQPARLHNVSCGAARSSLNGTPRHRTMALRNTRWLAGPHAPPRSAFAWRSRIRTSPLISARVAAGAHHRRAMAASRPASTNCADSCCYRAQRARRRDDVVASMPGRAAGRTTIPIGRYGTEHRPRASAPPHGPGGSGRRMQTISGIHQLV